MIVAEIVRNGRNGRDPWRPRVKRDGSRPVVELGGREIRSMTREVVDVETIHAGHERLGIDRVLLSPWVPLLYPEAEPESCLDRCRIHLREDVGGDGGGSNAIHPYLGVGQLFPE